LIEAENEASTFFDHFRCFFHHSWKSGTTETGQRGKIFDMQFVVVDVDDGLV
jgi:hypothetical protein